MSFLYLELFLASGVEEYRCPLETLIALHVYEYCAATEVTVVFVKSETDNNEFPIGLKNYNKKIQSNFDLPWQISSCKLPVFASENDIVTGLCGVARQLVKYRTSQPHTDEHPEGLLGFRSSCLQAPNEVSVWTKFCEVEIIQTTKSLMNHDFCKDPLLPSDIVRFEKHLLQPLRLHNVYKLARNFKNSHKKQQTTQDIDITDTHVLLKDQSNTSKRITVKHRKWKSSSIQMDESPLELLQYIEHAYSEGPFLTLADVMLYPCYSIIFKILFNNHVNDIIPKTSTWFKNLERCNNFALLTSTVNQSIEMIKCKFVTRSTKYILPSVENISLYKCDPKRQNPKKREFTKVNDVSSALDLVYDLNVLPVGENVNSHEEVISWSDIPSEANPFGHHLPDIRKERKSHQLSNIIQYVLSLAKEGHKIVDFCCGSGHLGILLAYLLPECTIILLENKEESLNRAKARIKNLGLVNVYFFQCNIDYYIGDFDIGVALHACGIATDLVLEKCINIQASFVICPCCYGSLHYTERLQYPRSKIYSDIPLEKYLCICHAADQTHENHPLQQQGQLCMNIIDSDRSYHAIENGYTVYLTKMKPPNCTPKNMMLVGQYSSI